MRVRRSIMPFLIAVSVLVLAACAAGAETTTTTTAETTTTSPATTTTTTPAATETVFGYLHSFEQTDEGGIVVAIDAAEMLSGEEALAAAREDEVIGEDEDLPNDYYIRNPEEATTEYVVAPDAEVLLQASREDGLTQEGVDVETWSTLLGGEEDPGLDWSWYGAGTLPYHFDIQGGEVVGVEEQYLP